MLLDRAQQKTQNFAVTLPTNDVPLRRIMTSSGRSRFTSEKHNDLLGQEPTTEPVTSCLCVHVPSTQEQEIKGLTPRSKFRPAATVFQESYWTPKATLPQTSAHVLRLARRSRTA